ncbi:unnamed protein product [Peniophora sp. CBMAI 1063]|nr:unnamed protein product [Peniophora sp. CBMAI 1063]
MAPGHPTSSPHAFDWSVNGAPSPSESFLLFTESAGYSIAVTSNQPQQSKRARKRESRRLSSESFLSFSPPTSPSDVSPPNTLSPTVAYPRAGNPHKRAQSEAALGHRLVPALRTPVPPPQPHKPATAFLHTSPATSPTNAPATSRTFPPRPSNSSDPRPSTSSGFRTTERPRASSSHASERRPTVSRPPALMLLPQKLSSPDSPSPSPTATVDSFATKLPSPEELHARRIAKLRKHLSASVPAELVARPARKNSHRESVIMPPPRPSTSMGVREPEVDYERLKKIRRHLSASVPEHLVLKLPPRLDLDMFCDIDEEDEECCNEGYWSEPERAPSNESNSLEYHQYLDLPVTDDDGPVSVEVEVGVLGRVSEGSEDSNRSERPWPPTPTSTISSFRPVRVERGNRRESVEYAQMMKALRSLK